MKVLEKIEHFCSRVVTSGFGIVPKRATPAGFEAIKQGLKVRRGETTIEERARGVKEVDPEFFEKEI